MNDKPHAKSCANPCKNKPKTSPQHLRSQTAQPTLENRKQHGDTTLTSLGVYGSWLSGFRISRIPASHYSIPNCPVQYHGELKVNLWDYIGKVVPQKGYGLPALL